MIEQIFANLVSLAVLMTISAFFFKRWMDKVDTTLKEVCTSVDSKVSKTDCKDRMLTEDVGNQEVWSWLKYHTHTAEGEVIVPKR